MWCFGVKGKSTLKGVSQNVLVSDSVPGSWLPKSLHGTPSTTSPSSRLAFQRDSSPEYCGVSPHWLATFTTRTTLPLYFESGRALPSIVRKEKSCAVVPAITVSRFLGSDLGLRSDCIE